VNFNWLFGTREWKTFDGYKDQKKELKEWFSDYIEFKLGLQVKRKGNPKYASENEDYSDKELDLDLESDLLE
jgi:hypothetical protein